MPQTANYCLLLRVFDNSRTILAISNHDSQLEINNTTYTSNSTFNIDKVEINANLDEGNATVTLTPTNQEKDALLKNNKLKIEIFCAKINNSELQTIVLKRGTIGDIAIEGQKITLEIKSNTNILDNKINRRFNCR